MAFSLFTSLGDSWPSWTEQAEKKGGVWPMSAPLACTLVSRALGVQTPPPACILLVWVLVCTSCYLGKLGVPSNASWPLLSVLSLKSHHQNPGPLDSHLCYLLEVLLFCILRLGLIHFELFLVKGIRSLPAFLHTTPSKPSLLQPVRKTPVSLTSSLSAVLPVLGAVIRLLPCTPPLICVVQDFPSYC